jgi:hypothetical protein
MRPSYAPTGAVSVAGTISKVGCSSALSLTIAPTEQHFLSRQLNCVLYPMRRDGGPFSRLGRSGPYATLRTPSFVARAL